VIRSLFKRLCRTDEEGPRYHQAFVDLLRPLGTAANLLDVGCGDGRVTMDYARALAVPVEKVRGVDGVPELVRRAGEKFTAVLADIENADLPFPDESFDVVTCNQTLEHLKNVPRVMGEMERVLKVGGHLAVGVPNLSALINRLRLAAGRTPLCIAFPGPHVRSFTHHGLRAFLLSNAAFSLRGESGSSLYPLFPPFLEGGARRLPGLAAYMFFLLRKESRGSSGAWREATQDVGSTLFT